MQLTMVKPTILQFVVIFSANVFMMVDGVLSCSGVFAPRPDFDFDAVWAVEGTIVHFVVRAPFGTGWLALGFTEQTVAPFMFPADVITGWGFINGTTGATDSYTIGRSPPIIDDQSDIFNVSTEIGILFTLRFSRHMVTTDTSGNDVSIDIPRYWIWAVGPIDTDGLFLQHSERGVSFGTITLPSANDCPGFLIIPNSSTTTTTTTTTVQPTTVQSTTTTTITSIIQSTSQSLQSSITSVTPSPSPTNETPNQCTGSAQVNDSLGDATHSYYASWEVIGDEVTFSISVATPGWVGIGFSLSPSMIDADIIVSSESFVTDRYAFTYSEPLIDTNDNILNSSTNFINGTTYVYFTRKLTTNDTITDISLSDKCVYVLWACCGSVSGTTIGYHFDDRGILDMVCFPDSTVCPAEPVQPTATDPPVVTVPANDIVTTIETGRSVRIPCNGTSVNNDHIIEWYRIDNTESPNLLILVEELTDFTSSALSFSAEGGFLSPNISIDDFRVLYQTSTDQNQKILTSWQSGIDGGFIVLTSEKIAGEYACLARNQYGGHRVDVTISIAVPSPQSSSSSVYIRFIVFEEIVPVNNTQFRLAVGESEFLESIDIEREGIQIVSCIEVPSTIINSVLLRFECLLQEFPQRQSTILVGDEFIQFLANQFITVQGYSNISVTGFCDYEQTVDLVFGDYTWPETVGGQFVSQPCANRISSDGGIAIRSCIGFDLGWNVLIDFSDCIDQAVLPVPFVFYLRFSTNFNNMSFANSEILEDNLRIAIESSVPVSAQCVTVPIRLIDTFERVECRINGAVGSDSSLEAIEDRIIVNLIELNYLIPNSNITNVDGFCNTESTTNVTGTLVWNETIVNTTNTILCPIGLINATATRQCITRLNWNTPNVTECASIVTLAFQDFAESLGDITVENVEIFTTNLSVLVENSVSIPDQSVQNAFVVSSTLIRTAEIVLLPETTLPITQMITVSIVGIVDDVEEWPEEVIQTESIRIIQAFENVSIALVTQENFTNLTVKTEDVVLVAERIDTDALIQMGRTFTASRNNGQLQVISDVDNNQTNQDLQNNQLATLTFPSGIDIRQLTGNDDDGVGIFFVIYNQNSLFPNPPNNQPMNNQDIPEDNPVQDVVGSAVVSFTIAGLLPGTILPEPLLIDLRISDPVTGSSENITNATCVFYNFQISDWDPTGCETIFDPNSNSNEVTCRCTHLTNFACLVDISARVGDGPILTEAQTTSLEVVSYIGVTLSLLGLLLTFITFLIFKSIRQRDVTKFHLQLCISLTLMYIVFVSGIDKTDNRGGCITVGVLIHYFSLVAWMWMGAEAVLMFQKLIIIFGQTTWKYLLFVSIICWTVPIVPVVIPVGIDPDFYITSYDDNTTRSGFCYISHIGVFFGAFLGPILLVIIFNTVIYILVIRVLIKHNLQKNKHKLDKSSMTAFEAFKLVLSICGIMFLFGLTWIFAIFTFISTNRDAAFALQFIFALFNALQGFWIFFFFVLLNGEARKAWMNLLIPCKKNKQAPPTSKTDLSSAKNKYFTSKSTTSESTINDGTDTLQNNIYMAGKNPRKFSSDVVMISSTTIMEEEESSSSPDNDGFYPSEKKSFKFGKEEETQVDSNKQEDDLITTMKARVQRRSTKVKNRPYHVEQIDVDFFSDDEDDFFNN